MQIPSDQLHPDLRDALWGRTSVAPIEDALHPRRPALRVVRDEGLTTNQVRALGRRPAAGPPINTRQPRIPRARGIGFGVILAICLSAPAYALAWYLWGMLP